MNDKVKELVEFWAERLYEFDCIAKNKEPDWDNEIMPMHIAYNIRTKKLVHPDLALIDDKEYLPTMLCPNCEGLITSDVPHKVGYNTVIPLAEELEKE